MAAGNEQTARQPRRQTIKIKDMEQPGPTRRQTGRDQDQTAEPRTGSERQIAPRQTDGYDAGDIPRSSTSVVRYGPATTSSFPRITQPTTPIPQRQSKNTTRDLPPRTPRPGVTIASSPMKKLGLVQQLKHMHWLFLVGLGMAVVIILWMIGSVVLNWGMQRYNDLRYGNPRTYQTDAVVGQGGDSATKPSHFIAMNWNHQAVVIELKAGDPKQSVSYTAPIYIVGDNGDAPVTLEFKDVNNDKKVDMIIHIHLANEQIFVFLNDPQNDKFRPSTSNDNLKI